MKALIAGLALLCIGASAPSDTAVAALDGVLSSIHSGQPGCAAGVIEDARLVFARGYGEADLETHRPITPQTPFNLGSMSKSFTAAAIVLLAQDGALSTGDDVRRWLPELPDYGHPIRIRNLLDHSSGIRNHLALAAFQPGARPPGQAESLATVFRQRALNFVPGTRYEYNSTNYVLLAEIIARASRMPFERFLADRILRPLGMRHTGFVAPDLAHAYARTPDGQFRLSEQLNGVRGSSNLLSTLDDFAIWLEALESGRLRRGLLGRMMSVPHLDDGTAFTYNYGLSVDRNYDRVPGLNMISHGGLTAAYRSVFDYLPGHGFGVVMLCNFNSAPRDVAGAATDAWIAAHLPAPPAAAPPAEQPLSEAQAAAYAGIYYDAATDHIRGFVAEGNTLKLAGPRPAPLAFLGDGRFTLGDNLGFHFAGAAMVETGRDEPAIRFIRLPPAGTVNLPDYAGRYRASEVDGEILVRAEAGGLVVTAPFGTFRPTPIDRDGFWNLAADIMHLAFTRNAVGAVSGFTLTTTSGVGRLRFARVPEGS